MNKKLLIPALIITAVAGVVAVGISGLIGTAPVGVSNNNSSQKPTATSMPMPEENMNPNMSNTTESAQSAESASGDQVTYKGFAIVQKTLKVKKGTTVTWTNQDSAKHDVSPDVETADFKASELFGKGETYKVTFNTVGTYAYKCSPHPYMKGTIEVTE